MELCLPSPSHIIQPNPLPLSSSSSLSHPDLQVYTHRPYQVVHQPSDSDAPSTASPQSSDPTPSSSPPCDFDLSIAP